MAIDGIWVREDLSGLSNNRLFSSFILKYNLLAYLIPHSGLLSFRVCSGDFDAVADAYLTGDNDPIN